MLVLTRPQRRLGKQSDEHPVTSSAWPVSIVLTWRHHQPPVGVPRVCRVWVYPRTFPKCLKVPVQVLELSAGRVSSVGLH